MLCLNYLLGIQLSAQNAQERGHPILNLLSNPAVIPVLLLLAGSGIWWLLATGEKSRKMKILSQLGDEIFRLLAIAFGSNALLNFSEVMRAPYQALLLTKESVFVAVIITGTYNLWKQLPKLLADRSLLVALSQLILLLFSINHLFYYSLYDNPTSIGVGHTECAVVACCHFRRDSEQHAGGVALGRRDCAFHADGWE